MDAASKKKLKAQAHTLKPVVTIGQAGLTDAVLAEIDIALNCHELIKIKIRAEKEERIAISHAICGKTGADLVQTIGQITVIYRIKPQLPVKAKPKRLKRQLTKNKTLNHPRGDPRRSNTRRGL